MNPAPCSSATRKGENLSFIYNISFMADTVHRASLLPAPLQTPRLTFTMSQGDGRLAGMEQHTQGSGVWLHPSSHVGLHPLLPGKGEVGPPQRGGKGKFGLQSLQRMPQPNLGWWLGSVTFQKAFSGCNLVKRDAGWAGE